MQITDTYRKAVDYLYGLRHHGIKLGLGNTAGLLSLLGNPQNSFKAIHIAGTNGKGSTAACIASILTAAGHNVGLFTSPHLVGFTERIRVNGVNIQESDVVHITQIIREEIRSEKDLFPTFFEFVTAMAFFYFRKSAVQWAVIETGMGGRLDATNILSPAIHAITHIGMDHTEFLGATLSEIAAEKAGIIKDGVPLVVGSQEKEARDVIFDAALHRRATVYQYGVDFSAKLLDTDIKGTLFDYVSGKIINDIFISLAGDFQVENASVAVKTVELLNLSRIDEHVIKSGLSGITWEGRCELYEWRYPILFDGAHNPDAAAFLGKALKDIYLRTFKHMILIIGAMGDKDIEGFLGPLLPLARRTIFTTLGFQRAAKAEYLQSVAAGMGSESAVAEDMTDALNIAAGHYKKGDLVVITGSFYAVGEAKGAIGFDSSLIGLTEFG